MSKDKRAIHITRKKGQDDGITSCEAYTDPKVTAASSLQVMHPTETVNNLVAALNIQTNKLKSGDMTRVEEMLFSQAHTLDALCTSFINKSMSSELMEHFKTYMNVALKAQNQCRMTLQTLAEVKFPKPYIQNNKAQYQQVNNGVTSSHAHEKPKTANELLEDKTNEHEWVDTGTPKKTGRNDKTLETVEA